MERAPTDQPREMLVPLTPEQTGAVSGGLLPAIGSTVLKVACCMGCASYGRPGFGVLAAETGVA